MLLFNGSIVHGSYPNTTPDRFRRSLVGHYIEGTSEQVSKGYQPLLRMDGATLELEESRLEGSVCGVWAEADGQPVIELTGRERLVRRKGE